MATWNSRGLRGSTLEDLINRTNEKYLENGLAHNKKHPYGSNRSGKRRFPSVSQTAP